MFDRIILDLDGVIADFDKRVLELFPVPNFTKADITGYGVLIDVVCSFHNLTKSQFWNALTDPFWESLEFTAEADDILALIEKTGLPSCICTSPTFGACSGKQRWIAENLPGYFYNKRYFIGPGKEWLATPKTILIDDCEANVIKFNKAGGKGLLVPRPWNSNANQPVVPYIEWFLKTAKVL